MRLPRFGPATPSERPSGVRRTLRLGRFGGVAAAAVLPMGLFAPAAAVAAPASVAGPSAPAAGAVFVQLNAADGNQIAAYSRDGDGRLVEQRRYDTGGLGGTAVGAPLDALASQGSLVLDDEHETLLAVNAGSGTLTSFAVDGARLRRTGVVGTKGQFPVSVAVHDHLVFVLDAGGTGRVTGFRLFGSRLVPLPGSTRDLGLTNDAVPTFITAPSQVGFTPDGRTLVVTTKANNVLLTFQVGDDGRISATPKSTPSAGPVPFSFVTDPAGRIHVTNAGDGTQTSYRVGRDGGLVALGTSASTGGAALCWNVRVGSAIVGSNAGSATLSEWRIGRDGTTTVTRPVAASTPAGPIDLAVSRDGRYLYSQDAVAGAVGVYRVDTAGALTPIQTVTGLPQFHDGGMEGLAAF